MKKKLLTLSLVKLGVFVLLMCFTPAMGFDVGRWGYYWDLATQEMVHDTADVLRAEMPDTAERVVHDTAIVLRAEMQDTLLHNADREIAGRFSCAKGVGAQDTLFVTTTGGGADTLFVRLTADSAFIWSNNLEPVKIQGTIVSGLIHLYVDNAGVTPFLKIDQDGAGDAVMSWILTGGNDWTAGIDNSDDDDFKIAHGDDLAAGAETDFQIHRATGHEGIITLPNNSSIRAYVNSLDSMLQNDTLVVEFDAESWDAQGEWDPSSNHRFTAEETGYYHVSATVNTDNKGVSVSLGIYVDGAAYAWSPFTGFRGESTVTSDVYCAASSYIDIRITSAGGSAAINTGTASSYVSIHKFK